MTVVQSGEAVDFWPVQQRRRRPGWIAKRRRRADGGLGGGEEHPPDMQQGEDVPDRADLEGEEDTEEVEEEECDLEDDGEDHQSLVSLEDWQMLLQAEAGDEEGDPVAWAEALAIAGQDDEAGAQDQPGADALGEEATGSVGRDAAEVGAAEEQQGRAPSQGQHELFQGPAPGCPPPCV